MSCQQLLERVDTCTHVREWRGLPADGAGRGIASAEDALDTAGGQLFDTLHGTREHRHVSRERIGHRREDGESRGLHGGSSHGHEDVTAEELTVEEPCTCKAGRFHLLHEVGNVLYRS